MEWSLYGEGMYLEPFVFSNKKTQLDIAKEVIKAIRQGHKIIFIKGLCGTGKSAIALNIAKEFNKTSIVVPLKTLQKQYKEDYTKGKYVIKNGERLKIAVIDGRNNHRCPFKNCGCDDKTLPCTIEINMENIELLKEYINQNPFVDMRDFKRLKDIRRKSIAPVCPHWSPIICRDWFENYCIEGSEEKEYSGLKNKTFVFYRRKPGCGYYDQFNSYIDSDVIIFNSMKYELENIMDRKPATDIDIIDECDEFLDNLSAEKRINLDRLSRTLSSLKIEDNNLKELVMYINDLVLSIMRDEQIIRGIENNKIFRLKSTKIIGLLKCFLDNPEIINLEDDESDYFYSVYQTAGFFQNLFEDTYVTFYRNKYQDLVANLVTINLEKKLKEFTDKNRVFIMMSGTIHSDEVLKEIFGIKNYRIIEAEIQNQGTITKILTGLEKHFRYEVYKNSREHFLKALSECLERAKRPVLVHIHGYNDLPTEEERKKYNLNLKTKEEVIKMQQKYKRGELLQMFKRREISVLYSTTCKRGVDLPGSICNSILFTRFPYPNVSSLFWRVLRLSRPKHYQLFYFDKARREFLQQIYRGLRHKKDHIYLLSPDSRVLNTNFGNSKSF